MHWLVRPRSRNRTVSASLALILAALWTLPAVAQPYGDRDWGWHMGWSWGHMIFGGLMMILFWGGLIVLAVLLVRWLLGAGGNPRSAPAATRPTPLQILQERFAKGEIDKDEYQERRRVLSE